METDELVEYSVKVAGKYKELEEKNENYEKREDTFVTLCQKDSEQLEVKSAEANNLKEILNEMRGKHRKYLKRRLEKECADLRVCLEQMKHSKGEWTKEKEYLLQKIENEKLQLPEMRQSKEVERSQEKCKEDGACRERRRVETHSGRVHQKRATMNTCEHDLPCSTQVEEEDSYNVPGYLIMYPETTWLHDISLNSTNHTSCHDNGLFYTQESSLADEYLETVDNGDKVGYPNQFISMVTDGEDIPSPVEEGGCMNERGLVEDSGYEDQLPIQDTDHSDTQEMVTGKNSS